MDVLLNEVWLQHLGIIKYQNLFKKNLNIFIQMEEWRTWNSSSL